MLLEYFLGSMANVIPKELCLYAFSLLGSSDPSKKHFLQRTINMIYKCGLSTNHQYDLSHHTQGILNNYAPLFQACCSIFLRNLLKDLLDCAVEMSVVLIFDIYNIYSQYWGRIAMVHMASKCLRNIKDCF